MSIKAGIEALIRERESGTDWPSALIALSSLDQEENGVYGIGVTRAALNRAEDKEFEGEKLTPAEDLLLRSYNLVLEDKENSGGATYHDDLTKTKDLFLVNYLRNRGGAA